MGEEPSSPLAPAARAGTGIDVVIVTHRTRELLRSCLESLRVAGLGAVARVFVVDNNSRDGTVAMVRSAFPWVEVIPSERNLGFGAATNLAIARGSSPFVLVLNPDTRLVPGSLDSLLQVMDDHPEVGICGCRLVRDDGSVDHAARRSFPTIAGALGHFLLVGRSRFAPHALAQYRAPRVAAGPVDAVNGAFMLIRRAALEEVGTFDEGFWMYMEDLDLCFRFKEAGWTTWYEPSVDAAHVKGGSSGRIRNPRLDYAFHYGMFRFYRKHYAPRSNLVVNAIVYLGIGAKLLVSLVRNAVGVSVARART